MPEGALQDPPGTFCWAVDGVETCAEGPTGTKTPTSGYVWFEVRATVDGQEVTVFGQVAEGAILPAAAEHVVIAAPIAGSCERSRMTSPFGGCTVETLDAVCAAETVYAQEGSSLIVDALTDGEIALRWNAMIDVSVPADCCEDLDGVDCDDTPPAFTPAGPFAIAGHARVTL